MSKALRGCLAAAVIREGSLQFTDSYSCQPSYSCVYVFCTAIVAAARNPAHGYAWQQCIGVAAACCPWQRADMHTLTHTALRIRKSN